MLPPGLCAFPLTPMTGEAVDEVALAGLVSRAATAGVGSVGVLGSTGVYAYLSREERRAAVDVAVGAADGVPVLAGVGALRTRDVLLHAEDAQAAGASALLLAPVSYHRLRPEEVAGLYGDVAASSSVPIVLYDNPSTTGFSFTDALYAQIAELPQVAGLKMLPPAPGTAAERVARLREALPAEVSIGMSGDRAAAEALIGGCEVWYSVLAGLFPQAALAIVDAAAAGDVEAAVRHSSALEPIWSLGRRHGGMRAMAAAAEILGLIDAPSLPPPLLALDGDSYAAVEDALTATGLASP